MKKRACTVSNLMIARLVLMRYPETLNEIRDDPAGNGATEAYRQRQAREVAAVEKAIAGVDAQHMVVICRRFWDHPPGHTKPLQYDFMQDIPFSRTTMKRVCNKVIHRVAFYLGECSK